MLEQEVGFFGGLKKGYQEYLDSLRRGQNYDVSASSAREYVGKFVGGDVALFFSPLTHPKLYFGLWKKELKAFLASRKT